MDHAGFVCHVFDQFTLNIVCAFAGCSVVQFVVGGVKSEVAREGEESFVVDPTLPVRGTEKDGFFTELRCEGLTSQFKDVRSKRIKDHALVMLLEGFGVVNVDRRVFFAPAWHERNVAHSGERRHGGQLL